MDPSVADMVPVSCNTLNHRYPLSFVYLGRHRLRAKGLEEHKIHSLYYSHCKNSRTVVRISEARRRRTVRCITSSMSHKHTFVSVYMASLNYVYYSMH